MRKPPSRFDRALRPLLWVLAAVLIPLAVVVGLGRELFPLVSQQKDRIEAELVTRAGLYVRLGELEGGWRGLRPVINARDVVLYHPDEPEQQLLVLPRLQLKMDWWATLRDFSPRLSITLEGLAITVLLDETGRIQIKELMPLGVTDPAAAEKRLRWVLAQPELSLVESTVNWQVRPGQAQQIRDIRLQQARGRQDYRLQLDFRHQGSDAEQQLLLQVNGDPLSWQRLHWRAYLRLNDLTSWHAWAAWLPPDWQVENLSGQASVWMTGEPEQPLPTIWVQAESVHALLHVPVLGRVQLAGLEGRLQAQVIGEDQGQAPTWFLALDDLRGEIDGEPLPVNRLHVRQAGEGWQLAAGRVRLGPALALLRRQVTLPDTLQKSFDELQPDAVLTRLNLQLSRAADASWQWQQAQAEFKGLQWAATGQLPGASNLAGWFTATPHGGLAYLDSRELIADLRQVFREPTTLTRLTGGVRWLRQSEGWHVDSGLLRMVNPDADAVAQLSLSWPDQGEPSLELLARLQRGRVDSAYRYVPWPSAGDHTLAWLQRALKAGEVRQGDFLFSGHLAAGDRPGRFEMRLPVSAAELDYVPGWPAVKQLQGVVAIRGRALTVTAPSAQIMTARASQLQAHIPDLAKSVLAVDAMLDMDLADLQRLFVASPLQARTRGLTDVMTLSGPAKGQLSLSVPLRTGEVTVSVDAEMAGADVQLPKHRLHLRELRGPVSFHSERGLTADGLQGLLWGDKPARVSLQGDSRRNSWWRQQVVVDAPAPVSALANWSGLPLTSWMSGETSATARIDIPVAAPGAIQLQVNSDLQGLRSRMPAPLDKPAAQRLPVRYQGTIGSLQDRALVEVSGLGQISLDWQGAKLRAVQVGLGQGTRAVANPGLSLAVNWPALDVNAWQAWWAQPATRDMLAAGTSSLPLSELVLQVGRAEVGSWQLQQVRATVTPQEDAWRIQLSQLRMADRPQLGQLSGEAVVARQTRAWILKPLVVKAAAARFEGELAWREGRQSRTQLSGDLQTDNLGVFLTQLAVPPFLEAGKSRLSLDVTWPGSPEDFALQQLNGSFKAEVGKGRLKESGGINLLTRGFGLLNAGNLMRRLKLDFTDITRKGLNFDQIKLQGQLEKGIANPAGFDLTGPTVNISGKGWVDVGQQTLAQELRVGVPVSSAVPVVAGFLAGPIVGGALVAADLLLDKQLAKVTSLRYRVSGPWHDLKLDDEALELPPGVNVDALLESAQP